MAWSRRRDLKYGVVAVQFAPVRLCSGLDLRHRRRDVRGSFARPACR